MTRSEKKFFQQLPKMFERHVKVFKELGFAVNLGNPVFPKKAALKKDILAVIGTEKQQLIEIAPFAQYDSKVYPLDLMQQVISGLTQNVNYKILLFGGGKKEIAILDSLPNNRSNVINMAGKIKLRQELELISNLDVMLSKDSGNPHIAAILGVKVISLYGSTRPFAVFSPFNQPLELENALVSDRNQFPKLPTSVYGNKKIEGYENAMRTITVQEVVAAILK